MADDVVSDDRMREAVKALLEAGTRGRIRARERALAELRVWLETGLPRNPYVENPNRFQDAFLAGFAAGYGYA